jgi:hypothetical protein
MNKLIFIDSLKSHRSNLERIFSFSKTNRIVNSLKNVYKQNITVYSDDTIGFKKLSELFYFLIIKKKIDKLFFFSLETYSISYRAYVSEIFFLKKSNPISLKTFVINPKPFLEIFLRKIIISKPQTKLILSNELRKKYVKRDYAMILRNLPTTNWIECECNSNSIKISKPYILLPGRINNFKALKKINSWAISNNYKIVLCGIHKFNIKNIICLGQKTREEIKFLIKNSCAGIVIYSNSTVNQRFSASSKLYEFLVYNIPVIHNENLGLENEISQMKLNKKFLINLKNLQEKKALPKFNQKLNNNLVFEKKYETHL